MDRKVRELVESLHGSERMVSGRLVADVVQRESTSMIWCHYWGLAWTISNLGDGSVRIR